MMVAAAAGLAAPPASAGASLYDMSRMLDEPHPFAGAPPPPPQPRARRPGGAGRNYELAPARTRTRPVVVPATRRGAAPPPVTARATPPPAGADPARVAFAIGFYDINDNEEAAEFRIEWRGRERYWKLRPLAGGMVTSDAAIYGFGGLAADFDLGRRVVATPSFAAGLYSDGGGKDLGSVIEFRSALELAWRLDGGARLGLMFYHLSNASISNNNPGTEVLSLGYSIPLN